MPADIAQSLAESVMAAEIDVSLSYRMQVDHGCADALAVLTGGLDRYPVIPVFINSVAPPMATLRRARLLGDAVGRFLSRTGKRVLVVGSGGISHEPPVPELAGASDEVAERLIAGRNPSAEARAARQARTVAAAQAFVAGDSHLHPLNPEWDRAFLSLLASGELTAVDGMTNDASRATAASRRTRSARGSLRLARWPLAARIARHSTSTARFPSGSPVSPRCMPNRAPRWPLPPEPIKENPMTDPNIVNDIAARLRDAEATRQTVAPVRGEIAIDDIATAYAVQQANVDARIAQGERIVGRKIGLTSLAVQKQLGVDQPDFGALFASMAYGDSQPMPLSRLIQPKVEAEIALVLEHALTHERHTLPTLCAPVRTRWRPSRWSTAASGTGISASSTPWPTTRRARCSCSAAARCRCPRSTLPRAR